MNLEVSFALSPVTKSFLVGLMSGTCSTVLFQPFDLVKTRMQTSIAVGRPIGMVTVMSSVVQEDKLHGLWRGLTPSLSRSVPGIGVYFSSVHFLRSTFGSDKPKPLESFLTGAAARTMAGVLVIPFTVLKTRYESGFYDYGNGLRRALCATYKTEGVKALISGMVPTLLRDVPFSSLYLMFYTELKQVVNDRFPNSLHIPVFHFGCGLQAGMIAAIITQPADVIKTHMQLRPNQHKTVADTIMYIYSKDGTEGFMRGVVPRTIRRTLMAAMAWAIYDNVAKKFGLI